MECQVAAFIMLIIAAVFAGFSLRTSEEKRELFVAYGSVAVLLAAILSVMLVARTQMTGTPTWLTIAAMAGIVAMIVPMWIAAVSSSWTMMGSEEAIALVAGVALLATSISAFYQCWQTFIILNILTAAVFLTAWKFNLPQKEVQVH